MYVIMSQMTNVINIMNDETNIQNVLHCFFNPNRRYPSFL